ncbi:hypothetical protein SNE40_021889 [Patella caerulea]|uniref:MKRN2 opposite strand protein n=1 Tax=Patella caerulea TaxID=87958 RepID=A0AAN8J4D8_PATCE
MQNQSELRCFQHCDRSTNIICFDVPEHCPLCGKNTSETESRIPPYILPSPIAAAVKWPRSLVLKPTDGDFLCDFTKTSNLHIGVTDSTGTVYDFDEYGLHVGSPWLRCIQVPVLSPGDIDISDWDNILFHYAKPNNWTQTRYHEMNNNCFDFVLGFLRSIPHLATIPSLSNKRTFCDDFVVRKTMKISQYISLYKQVLQNGSVCQKT